MGYTIAASGNKPSSVALHQNHAIHVVFIEMLKQMTTFYSKSQNDILFQKIYANYNYK